MKKFEEKVKEENWHPTVELVVDYHEGFMPQKHIDLITEHLEGCQGCNDVYLGLRYNLNEHGGDYEKVQSDISKFIEEFPDDEQIESEVLEVHIPETTGKGDIRPFYLKKRYLSAVAVLLFLLGYFAYNQNQYSIELLEKDMAIASNISAIGQYKFYDPIQIERIGIDTSDRINTIYYSIVREGIVNYYDQNYEEAEKKLKLKDNPLSNYYSGLIHLQKPKSNLVLAEQEFEDVFKSKQDSDLTANAAFYLIQINYNQKDYQACLDIIDYLGSNHTICTTPSIKKIKKKAEKKLSSAK